MAAIAKHNASSLTTDTIFLKVANPERSTISVSYTHLDVYKRQEPKDMKLKGNLLKKVLPNTSLSVLWIKNVLSVAVRNRLVRNTQRNVSGNASK